MGPLLLLGIPAVMKADSAGEGADVFLIADEEMPAFGGLGAAKSLDVIFFFLAGELGALQRIETDGENLELTARLPIHLLQGLKQLIELQAAEHRTAVVVQREQHRALAEVI